MCVYVPTYFTIKKMKFENKAFRCVLHYLFFFIYSFCACIQDPPDAITLASLRLLSVWLAEDSEPHPLVNDVLPTLLKIRDPTYVHTSLDIFS